MNRAALILLVLLLTALALAPELRAQQAEPPVWVITKQRVPGNMQGQCLASWNKYLGPIDAEMQRRGLLLQNIVLTHYYADEYNVITMRKYRDWNAVREEDLATPEVRRGIWNDAQWQEFQQETAACAPDYHSDQIYLEYTPTASGM